MLEHRKHVKYGEMKVRQPCKNHQFAPKIEIDIDHQKKISQDKLQKNTIVLLFTFLASPIHQRDLQEIHENFQKQPNPASL